MIIDHSEWRSKDYDGPSDCSADLFSPPRLKKSLILICLLFFEHQQSLNAGMSELT